MKIYNEKGQSEVLDPAIDDRYTANSDLLVTPSLYNIIVKSGKKSEIFSGSPRLENIKAAKQTEM